MSETKLIHNYLRHNKSFPTCSAPGCGHGIAVGSLIRSIHALGLTKDEVVLVAGIGCSGRVAVYMDFNTIHTTHGRALTFATGIKMANPELTVIAIMGDGDAFSIGGNHLIHAARRNIGITALVLNNNIYGMTGGQCSSTITRGAYSTTTPIGQLEKSSDIVRMAEAAGANFVARSTSFHPKQCDKIITKALDNPGFNLVEILSPCFTHYGRKNRYRNVVDMHQELKNETINIKAWRKLEEEKQSERLPIGIFVENDAPGLEELYGDLKNA